MVSSRSLDLILKGIFTPERESQKSQYTATRNQSLALNDSDNEPEDDNPPYHHLHRQSWPAQWGTIWGAQKESIVLMTVIMVDLMIISLSGTPTENGYPYNGDDTQLYKII